MINLATKKLNHKHSHTLYRNAFDHILIDEYQDISTNKYDLIKTLMEKNPNCKLFCVGDDWQSIMGFTGSNLDLFKNFSKYFDNPEITYLETNYRSCKSIVETGNEIIAYNGEAQIQKNLIAENQTENQLKIYLSMHKAIYRDGYYNQIIFHCIDKIKEYLNNDYNENDIKILTRIIEKPKMINKLREYANYRKVPIIMNGEKINHIPCMSIHKSKGLEAQIVFILDVIQDDYGLPCELDDKDQELFEPIVGKINKEEEERRLFYVAVTRARKEVHIYTQKCLVSKFLKEINDNTIKVDLSYSESEPYVEGPSYITSKKRAHARSWG